MKDVAIFDVIIRYVPSAVVASDRLKWIIKRDRELAQEGRWEIAPIRVTWVSPREGLEMWQVDDPLKPHYRWQARR